MPSPLPLPPHAAAVSELLNAAARLFRATLAKCLPLAMLAALAIELPVLTLLARSQTLDIWHPPTDPQFWILYSVGLLTLLWLMGAAMLRQGTMVRGQPVNLAGELRQSAWRLLVLVPALFLVLLALATIVNLFQIAPAWYLRVLALLPVLYLVVCFWVLMPIVLFESGGAVNALVRSLQLVRPLWWKCCFCVVIGLGIAFVCLLAAMAVLGLVLGPGAVVAGSVLNAISTVLIIGLTGAVWLFFSALAIVLYSAASSSA